MSTQAPQAKNMRIRERVGTRMGKVAAPHHQLFCS
jgi:hypothetical protein